MMSCLWILVFGSLIVTGVKTQEGEAEGSEEANIEATDQPPAEADDPALLEDEGAGNPEPATEAGTADTVEDTEEPVGTEAEPEVTGSEQDETTELPSEMAEKPVTENPVMDSTALDTELNQEEAPTVKTEGPQGGESDPTEGHSDLSEQGKNTPSPPEEGGELSLVDALDTLDTKVGDLSNIDEVSAENGIGDAESPSEGAGKVRSAGAVSEPNGLGSGTVAGVVAAIGVAIIAAISSYLTYQKKMLCFKVQGRDPERAKEENGTQNDPQALSGLLNSP